MRFDDIPRIRPLSNHPENQSTKSMANIVINQEGSFPERED
jgi:hypothetical protein